MTGIRLETSGETGLVGVLEGRGRLPPPEVSRLAGMSFLHGEMFLIQNTRG